MSLETHPENAFANDRAHVFHSWSAQAALNPLVIEGGQGSWIWDQNGKKYLDFSSQLVNVNIGHQHPKLVAGIQEYAGKLCTIAPFHANDARSEAARLIVEAANGGEGNDKGHGMSMVFFTNGGAEGNENAIRMARLHTGRHKILTTYRSYHGGTAAAIQMTGDPRRWPSEPSTPGIVKFWGPYPYRSAFHSTTEAEETQRSLQHLRRHAHGRGPAHRRRDRARDRRRHQRHPRPAARLPRRRPRAVRPPRHPARPRRGDGRLRPLRRVVRVPRVRRAPRPHRVREGCQQRLPAPRRCGASASTWPRRSWTRPYPGGLTYSGHPLACASASSRASTSSRRRASSSTPACSAPT